MKTSGKGKKKTGLRPEIATKSEAPIAIAAKPAAARPTVPTSAASRASEQERYIILAILGVTLLVYLNSLIGKFAYDDSYQILKNPTIKSLENIPSMFTQGVWQFMNASVGDAPTGIYYRPLFNILLIINYHLFGFEPFGWHLVSVLLHLGATLLVYLFVRQWAKQREVAALTALLFGLHPVHSESVAWISAVPDPLALVFLLSSLLLYERYYREPKASQYLLVASMALALLALFSKEVAIVLPVLIVIRELLVDKQGETALATLTRIARRVAPFVLATIVYLAARYAVLGFISKTEPKAVGVTAAHVSLTVPSVLLSYARMLFVPYPLAIIYDHKYVNAASDPRFWGVALAVIALIAVTLWLVRHSRSGIWALALLLLFLLPVLNLKTFNPEESIIHDRYLYLPSIGFCWLIALGLAWLRERLAAPQKRLVTLFIAAICVTLFGLTFVQNLTWQDDVTMAEHALEFAPRKPFLYNYLGAWYGDQKNLAEAEKKFAQAINLQPDYYDALSNLGDLYYQQNKFAEAEKFYAQAVAAGAIYSQTYYNYADSLAKQRKFAEAERPLRRAIEIRPNFAEAYFYLAWVNQQQGKLAQAEQGYQQTLAVKPTYLEARINLASVLSDLGRLQEALGHLEIVKQRAPAHQVMLYTLGEVYRKSNRLPEAVTALSQLVNAQPQHQMGQLSLGMTYEQSGETAKAKLHFQQAIDIAPQEQAAQTAREHLAKLP